MSARTNLVLTDRAATPVAHTYTPDGTDANGVAVFSENTAVPAGNPRYSASQRKSNGKYRTTLRLAVPVVATQTINGVSTPTVLRTSYVDCEFVFDALSTDQERKDVVGMFYSSLPASQTMLNDLLVNLSAIY